MTVLHLITSLGGGGAEALLHLFVKQSKGRHHRHVVVSMVDEDVIGRRIREDGIPLYTLNMRRGRPSLRGLLALLRIVRTERPAIIQTWMYHANLLGTAAAIPARIPLLWCLHAADVDTSVYGRMFALTRSLCARLSPLADVVIANSAATYRDHLRLGFKARRWEVIGNGFDTELFRPDPAAGVSVRRELAIPGDAPIVGLMARFDPMKDHATFVAAAALLLQRYPDMHFLCAGADAGADNQELAAMRDRAGLAERLHLLGFRTDIARVTASLDIATSTSIFGESFSNTTAEAMASGVPCVVTRVAALPELVGDAGIVVPPRDPQALAAAWAELIQLGPEARAELGRRGRRRVLDSFTVGRMVEAYERLYATVQS